MHPLDDRNFRTTPAKRAAAVDLTNRPGIIPGSAKTGELPGERGLRALHASELRAVAHGRRQKKARGKLLWQHRAEFDALARYQAQQMLTYGAPRAVRDAALQAGIIPGATE
jgi:hypothetical protein